MGSAPTAIPNEMLEITQDTNMLIDFNNEGREETRLNDYKGNDEVSSNSETRFTTRTGENTANTKTRDLY